MKSGYQPKGKDNPPVGTPPKSGSGVQPSRHHVMLKVARSIRREAGKYYGTELGALMLLWAELLDGKQAS